MTSNTCLNCGTALQGKFCHVCGQENKHAKIDWHFVWHDIQHGLLHVDKGILYTTKELFTRPGHAIREYLEGKRVKHFKPISFVIILAGLYGFLLHYFDISVMKSSLEVQGNATEVNETKAFIDKIADWISTHYTLVSIAQLPLFTISTYLLFRKMNYNFVEHFILNTYLIGMRLLLRLAVFPVYYYLRTSQALVPFSQAIDFVSTVFMFWAMYQFFTAAKPFVRSVKIILSFLITMGLGLAIIYSLALLFIPHI